MKILLADDSMTAQNMGKKILVEAGYDVVAVSNGAAAMKKIAAERPDLLVLDVYMPGYSGLEVCQKVRADADTGRIPVLLTVGKMEPFQQEEAGKVRADGVIIKPFEASDLLAAVKKLEEKVAAAAAEQSPAMPTPAASPEFQDASYEEWKVTAPEVEEEAPAPPKFAMSEEMAAGPAFGMEEEAAPAADSAMQTAGYGDAAAELVPEEPVQVSEPLPPLDPEVEFTSPPRQENGEAEAAPAVTALPELETAPAAGDAPAGGDGRDPALVTDASEMATAFPTSFGVEGAEPVPVGVASEVPGLYDDERAAVAEAPVEADAAPETEAPPEAEAPPAEEAPYPHEMSPQHYGVEHEMAVSEPVPEPEPEPPPAAAEQGPDPELAAALSAAMSVLPPQPSGEDVAPPEPEPEPPPAPEPVMLDAQAVAAAVDQVLQRHKAGLMAEIMRELEQAGRQ
jgi:CheY-like chemotaxis protein